MKKLTSIRTNLFLAMVLIVLIMSAVFLPYGFYSNIKSVRNSVDERLKAAAESLAEIMPNGFQKRLESGKAGMEETGELRKKISRLKNSSSLTSLYAIYKDSDGKIRYLIDEIFPPNAEMENPNPRILSAFETRNPTVAQIKDDTFDFMARTAIIPMESDDGAFFIGVAELETASIRPIIFNSLLNFFILLSLGSFLALIAAASVARKYSRPMRRLSSFTQKLTESNFDKGLKLSDTLPESEVRFIHEADTDVKKKELFQKTRKGEVRVLLGSTQKMLPTTRYFTLDAFTLIKKSVKNLHPRNFTRASVPLAYAKSFATVSIEKVHPLNSPYMR